MLLIMMVDCIRECITIQQFQPYTLPYVVGHSKVNHSDWIRTALVQAICYCSAVEDFNRERIYIELTCLTNGYSTRFVDSRISHFYDYFQDK